LSVVEEKIGATPSVAAPADTKASDATEKKLNKIRIKHIHILLSHTHAHTHIPCCNYKPFWQWTRHADSFWKWGV